MLEHRSVGALGVVLNAPLDILAADALPDEISPLVDVSDVVHRGGPVEASAVIIVVELRAVPSPAGTVVFGSVAVLNPDYDIRSARDAVSRSRVFSGYAGWSDGQLEREIGEGAWIEANPEPGDVFATEPESLWRRVLERKGGNYRLLARMPIDPQVN